MEMKISNGFYEISENEMNEVDGGGALEAGQAFLGTVLVGCSPAIGVGVTIVAGPVAGVAAGLGAASLGSGLIGAAAH